MTSEEELRAVDAEWDRIVEAAPGNEGTFGHDTERRLGLRVPAVCWALLRDGDHGVYARTVEISPTSTVLRFLDPHGLRFEDTQKFALDLFVPTSSRPIHATARPARALGALEAFELSDMNAADRLTLAEHLDKLATKRTPPRPVTTDTRTTPTPLAWRRFVMSLKQPAAAEAQRF
jgi:hypothetical protein